MDARQLPRSPEELADTMAEYTTSVGCALTRSGRWCTRYSPGDHTVAMTGDGSTTCWRFQGRRHQGGDGSGSPASRAVAQIVLLDNKFATLPYVVGEGRRVIGNIERVSNLF